jgi:hypothetical protein
MDSLAAWNALTPQTHRSGPPTPRSAHPTALTTLHGNTQGCVTGGPSYFRPTTATRPSGSRSSPNDAETVAPTPCRANSSGTLDVSMRICHGARHLAAMFRPLIGRSLS